MRILKKHFWIKSSAMLLCLFLLTQCRYQDTTAPEKKEETMEQHKSNKADEKNNTTMQKPCSPKEPDQGGQHGQNEGGKREFGIKIDEKEFGNKSSR